LTNLIIVVTRYFGGTKLGTGGLARAYTESAIDVLSQCEIVTEIIYQTVRFQFPYEETNAVMRLIRSFEGRIADTLYDSLTEMTVEIRAGKSDLFRTQLVDQTRGQTVLLEIK
jgi:putative IMPACT (imprinted ancient) family translation regulator